MEETLPYRLYLDDEVLRGRAGAAVRPSVVPRRPGRGRAGAGRLAPGRGGRRAAHPGAGRRRPAAGLRQHLPAPRRRAVPRRRAGPRPRRAGAALPLPPLDLRARRTAAGGPAPRRACRPTSRCSRSGVAVWGGFVFVCLRPGRRGRRWPSRSATATPHTANYPLADAPPRRQPHLRGGRQLEGHRRELQRVLPLRSGPPGAVRAGAGLPARRRRPICAWDDGIPHRDGAWTFTASGTSDPGAVPGPRAPRSGSATRARWSTRTCCSACRPTTSPPSRSCPAPPATPPCVCDFLFAPDEIGLARLRPDRRGRLLGPGQPAGLAHRRERAAGHGLLRGRAGLVRADGGRLGRHRPLVPRP